MDLIRHTFGINLHGNMVNHSFSLYTSCNNWTTGHLLYKGYVQLYMPAGGYEFKFLDNDTGIWHCSTRYTQTVNSAGFRNNVVTILSFFNTKKTIEKCPICYSDPKEEKEPYVMVCKSCELLVCYHCSHKLYLAIDIRSNDKTRTKIVPTNYTCPTCRSLNIDFLVGRLPLNLVKCIYDSYIMKQDSIFYSCMDCNNLIKYDTNCQDTDDNDDDKPMLCDYCATDQTIKGLIPNKICPSCQHSIIKIDGCDNIKHITKHCNCIFCYKCGVIKMLKKSPYLTVNAGLYTGICLCNINP